MRNRRSSYRHALRAVNERVRSRRARSCVLDLVPRRCDVRRTVTVVRFGTRVPATAIALVVAGCILGACHSTPQPSQDSAAALEATVLEAPSPGNPHDLDLHLHWRAAAVYQVLPPLDLPSAFRQFPEVVALDGEAHRALLLLPSLKGEASVAKFRVHL